MSVLKDKISLKGYWSFLDDSLISNNFLDYICFDFPQAQNIYINFESNESNLEIVVDGEKLNHCDTPIFLTAKNLIIYNTSSNGERLCINEIKINHQTVLVKNIPNRYSDKLIITTDNKKNIQKYITNLSIFSKYDFILCKSMICDFENDDVLEKLWMFKNEYGSVIKRDTKKIKNVILDYSGDECLYKFNERQLKFKLKVLILELIKAYHSPKIELIVENKRLYDLFFEIGKLYTDIKITSELKNQ